MNASTASSPADTKPSDSAVSLSLTIGTTAAPAPVPLQPPTKTTTIPAPKPAPIAALIVSGLQALYLHVKHPTLVFHLKASKTTLLTIVLLDARGHKLATWTHRALKGANLLELVLPAKAK